MNYFGAYIYTTQYFTQLPFLFSPLSAFPPCLPRASHELPEVNKTSFPSAFLFTSPFFIDDLTSSTVWRHTGGSYNKNNTQQHTQYLHELILLTAVKTGLQNQ